MGIFSFLRPRFQTRESAAGPLISFSNVGQAKWTPRNYAQLADEGYQKNIVAYRCIQTVATAAATVPLMLFNRGTDTEQEDHPLIQLLERPNPLQGRVAFMESLYAFYLIAGNAYIEAAGPTNMSPDGARLSKSLPSELWNLRPDRMKVIPGDAGVPEAFQYEVGGRKTNWDVDKATGHSPILHMQAFHPTNDWYGFSAIEAAAWSIDQHNAASTWNKALLDNSGRPSGALVYSPREGKQTLSDEKFERLKAQMAEKMNGPLNSGRPMILDGGLDWKEMSLSPKDMDWLKGKDVSAREIALAFGVPGQLVGVPDQQTYANNREARLALYEDTVLPLVMRALTHLTSWLAPIFGDEIELRPDIDEIPALVLRRERVWDRVQTSDFLTINEKRAAVGYEPVGEEGDVILVSAANIPLDQAVAEPEPVPDALDPNTPGGINPEIGEGDDEGDEEPKPEDDDEGEPDPESDDEKAGRLAYG